MTESREDSLNLGGTADRRFALSIFTGLGHFCYRTVYVGEDIFAENACSVRKQKKEKSFLMIGNKEVSI